MKQINSDKLYTVNRKRKRNFLKAAALFVIGAFLFNPGFFTDFARAEAETFLRVPAIGEKNYSNALKASLEGDLSLSVDELISKLGRALPGYEEENPDYTEVYEIIGKLEERRDVEIMLFGGSKMNKKNFQTIEKEAKEKGIKITRQWNPNQRFWEIYSFFYELTKIFLPKAERFVLSLLLENGQQHVAEGIVFVVAQFKKGNYTKMTVIDNGKGFVDKGGKEIPIEDAIKWEKSFGNNGDLGQALTMAVGTSDFSIIETP